MFSLGGRSLLFSFYPPERRKALADFLRWILFSGRRLITFRLFFVREKPFLTIETLYLTVYCGMCVLATQTHKNRIVFFFAGNRNSFCFVLYVVLTDMPSVSCSSCQKDRWRVLRDRYVFIAVEYKLSHWCHFQPGLDFLSYQYVFFGKIILFAKKKDTKRMTLNNKLGKFHSTDELLTSRFGGWQKNTASKNFCSVAALCMVDV